MVLTHIIEKALHDFPTRRAVSMRQGYRTVTLTYKEVYQHACQIAHFLEQQGIGKGHPVIIMAPNSPQWLTLFWGCLLRGAFVVPLNTQSTTRMIEAIVQQTEARIAFVGRLSMAKMPSSLAVFPLDYLHELVQQNDTHITPVHVSEDDLVEVMYTSGTTGEPKGVMLTHKNIATTMSDGFKLFPETHDYQRLLSILPLSHIFEQVCTFLCHFLKGEEIVFVHTPTQIMQLMNTFHVTKMMVVPEFLHVVMSRIRMQADQKGKRASFERALTIAKKLHCRWVSHLLFRQINRAMGGKFSYCVSGGAHLSLELSQEWEALGVTVLSGYGLTETASLVSTNTFEHNKPGSVGKPIPSVSVRLANDGEILVKGANIFGGYYKNPEKTAAAFTDGWFKTGDLGEIDADGYLYIRGRKQYRIKGPGGQNVFPEDIESALNSIEGVKSSCVVGRDLSHALTEIHASLILDDTIADKEQAAQAIIKQANSTLATYQQITGWSVWPQDDFPRTVTKKIKKNDIIAYLDEQAHPGTHIPDTPSHVTQSPLITIIATITGINSALITPQKRLISDLKLDSLMRVELVARIEESLSVVISEAVITPETTLHDLEEIIKRNEPAVKAAPIARWSRSQWAHTLRALLQPLIFAFTRLFVKLEVKGLENLQNLSGPVILMPNHISYLDSIIVPMALPRKIRRTMSIAAARDMLYEQYGSIAWIAELVFNCFPIQREDTPDAQLSGQNIKLGLEYMGQMLDWGYSIILYPEGKLGTPEQMHDFKQGAGLVAIEMGCPVIPINIKGTADIMPSGALWPTQRGTVTVTFGKPLTFNHINATYSQATQQIRKEVEKL